jgi:hypothetical protein
LKAYISDRSSRDTELATQPFEVEQPKAVAPATEIEGSVVQNKYATVTTAAEDGEESREKREKREYLSESEEETETQTISFF